MAAPRTHMGVPSSATSETRTNWASTRRGFSTSGGRTRPLNPLDRLDCVEGQAKPNSGGKATTMMAAHSAYMGK